MEQGEQGTLLAVAVVGLGAFVGGKFLIDAASSPRPPSAAKATQGSAGPPQAMQDIVRWVGTIWAAWTLIQQAPAMATELEKLSK